MIFGSNTNLLKLNEPFLDEYSYISFNSKKYNVNESLGIAELNNKKYHESLDDAAQKILNIVDKMKRLSYKQKHYCTLTVTSKDSNGKDAIQEQIDNLEMITVPVRNVTWINEVNILIQYPALINDGRLLGDFEQLTQVNPNAWTQMNIHITKSTLFSTKNISIPLKINKGKITQCFVLITISHQIPNLEEVSTMLDHELGHAKNVLEHQTSIKDMNADLIDFEALYNSFVNLDNNPFMKRKVALMHQTLSQNTISSNIKQAFLSKKSNVDQDVIVSWFLFNYESFNASEIVQHRKNFLLDIKNNDDISSAENYLINHSKDYKHYSELAQVLRSLVDFTPTDIKQKVVDEFIRPIVSANRGEGHKQYVYGRIFAGRHKNFGVNAFNEFMLYHMRQIEKYFIERCRRLARSLSLLENSRFKRHITLTSSLYISDAKRIVEQAEEELLID